MMSSLIERLRQLVGSNTWDYCVLWKLSEDQRFLEFVDCCCGGSEQSSMQSGSGGGDELIMYPCRDVTFQHPRTTTCEALAQLPSSHPLDGINMEILISNQPRWLNFSNVSDLNVDQVTAGTKVLIPIPEGMAELFAAKQVNEDQNIIDYVMEQCVTIMEHEAINTCNNNVGLSYSGNGFEELMKNHSSSNNTHHMHVMEHSLNEQQQQQCGSERGSALKGSSVDAVVSDSNHLDELDDIDPKCPRKAVKGTQAKNLFAERKRRQKLSERLYHLRSLVPNISKLDRAAILGDAIKYVQELQKEQNDLQNELERNSDDEAIADHTNVITNHYQSSFSSEVSNPLGRGFGPDYDHQRLANDFHHMPENSKRNHDFKTANDKAQQMEVQVQVAQLDGNDFFVKVFGEQKRGGFVRLMEAFKCLGLEITNVNMTSCISLVSYVFIVKKKDSEMVQVEYLRDSLLEATRSQSGLIWAESMAKLSSTNENGMNHQHIHRHQHQQEHYQHHQHQSHMHHIHCDHINPLHSHFHHLNS